MRPHDKQKTPILMVNGVDYGPMLGIPEFSFDGEAGQAQKALSIDGGSFSAHCTMKVLRCKTRKRFVKLLMAKGTPKRKAEAIADGVCFLYGSYQKAWDTVFWTGTVRYANIEKLKRILRREKWKRLNSLRNLN